MTMERSPSICLGFSHLYMFQIITFCLHGYVLAFIEEGGSICIFAWEYYQFDKYLYTVFVSRT